jgi:AcrR family transcriptional regulator
MEDVALEAGVSKGAPYIYFASKEALFRALYEWWGCGLCERVEAAVAELASEERQSPQRVLRAVLLAVGDHVIEEPDACRVLMEAQSQAHYLPSIAETVRASRAQSLAGLEHLIRAGMARGEESAETDPELQARLLLAALYGLMAHWHLHPGAFSWPEAAAALADQLMPPVDHTTERSIIS